MSWHINRKGTSIIETVFNELSEDSYMIIFTKNNSYDIYYTDKWVIGNESLYIESLNDDGKKSIYVININHIESIECHEYVIRR